MKKKLSNLKKPLKFPLNRKKKTKIHLKSTIKAFKIPRKCEIRLKHIEWLYELLIYIRNARTRKQKILDSPLFSSLTKKLFIELVLTELIAIGARTEEVVGGI